MKKNIDSQLAFYQTRILSTCLIYIYGMFLSTKHYVGKKRKVVNQFSQLSSQDARKEELIKTSIHIEKERYNKD